MARSTQSLILAAILSVGIACGVTLGRLEPRPASSTPQARELPAAVTELQAAFNRAAEGATRSVVHITTRSTQRQVDPRFAPSNVGSGVILTPEGHIVTNHHVVENARQLIVRLSDGGEVPARIVGLDKDSDLALLQIDPEGRKLQPMALADSDRVRVGDFVLAIGSPYGYNHTVTSGIVSAKHRVTEWGKPYEDFIQTDAAINPGNSGGALINLQGELIGINAAIVSQGRGSEGIGLAISAKLVKWVVSRLQSEGRVRRGYLGVMEPQDINQQLVDMLANDGIRTVDDLLAELGLEKPMGALILGVQQGSPAARAGLRERDVIVEFNGKKVQSRAGLFFEVAEAMPGQKVKIKFLRDRKAHEVEVELVERPSR